MKVKQKFLQPGRFHVGGGKFHDLTKQEIAEYVAGTRELIKAGYSPPVLFEHAGKGDAEGSPRQNRADQVRNGAGWLTDVEIDQDGAAFHVLDITDPTAEQKIRDKSIKFTSPELRPIWTDGRGHVFEHTIAHVALTHSPRNIEQSEFMPAAAAMQFSLADWEPIQMGLEELTDEKVDKTEALDGSPESPSEPSETEPENPDMPETEADGEQARKIESILAYLSEFGVELPADTACCDICVILDRVQTGLMSAAAAIKKNKIADEPETSDEPGDDAGDPPPVVEQSGMVQYSLAQISKHENKLLRKVVLANKSALEQKLAGMVSKSKLTPAARDTLLSIGGAMQFSADGDFVAALSIDQVAAVLDNCLPEGASLGAADLDAIEQFSEIDHPDGEKHYSGDKPLSEAQAKKFVDAQAAQLGGMFKK